MGNTLISGVINPLGTTIYNAIAKVIPLPARPTPPALPTPPNPPALPTLPVQPVKEPFDESNFKLSGLIKDSNSTTTSEVIINCVNGQIDIYVKTIGTTIAKPNSKFELYYDQQGTLYKKFTDLDNEKDTTSKYELTAHDFSQGKSPYPQPHIVKYTTDTTDTTDTDDSNNNFTNYIKKNIVLDNKIYLHLGHTIDWIYDTNIQQTNPKIFGFEDVKYETITSKTTLLKQFDNSSQPKPIVEFLFNKDIKNINKKPITPIMYNILNLEDKISDPNIKPLAELRSDDEFQKLCFDLQYMDYISSVKKYITMNLSDVDKLSAKLKERIMLADTESIEYKQYQKVIGFINNVYTEVMNKSDLDIELKDKLNEYKKYVDSNGLGIYMINGAKNYINTKSAELVNYERLMSSKKSSELELQSITLQSQSYVLKLNSDVLKLNSDTLAKESEELKTQSKDLATQKDLAKESEELKTQSKNLATQSKNLATQSEKLAKKSEELKPKLLKFDEQIKPTNLENMLDNVNSYTITSEDVILIKYIKNIHDKMNIQYDETNFDDYIGFISYEFKPYFFPNKNPMLEITSKLYHPNLINTPKFKPFVEKNYISLASKIATVIEGKNGNYSVVPPKQQGSDEPGPIDPKPTFYTIPIYSSYDGKYSKDYSLNSYQPNGDGIGYTKTREIIGYGIEDIDPVNTSVPKNALSEAVQKNITISSKLNDVELQKISSTYNLLYRIKCPDELKPKPNPNQQLSGGLSQSPPLPSYPYDYIPNLLGLNDSRYLSTEPFQDVVLSSYVYNPLNVPGISSDNYMIKIGRTWVRSVINKFNDDYYDRLLVCTDDYNGNLFHSTNGPGIPVPPGQLIRKNIMFVFEGSVDFSDWLSDALAITINTDIGKVHLGFWLKFLVHRDSIWKELSMKYDKISQTYSTPYEKIIFGGHSLGGAIAQVAAAYFAKYLPNVKIEVVSHGAPCPFKVNNHVFDFIKHKRYTAWTRDECWCIPNTNDPVPTILNFFDFKHTQINETDPHRVGTNQYPCREVVMRSYGPICVNDGSYYDKNTTGVNVFWEALGVFADLYDVVMGAINDHSVNKSYMIKIRRAYCGTQYDSEYGPNYWKLLNEPDIP